MGLCMDELIQKIPDVEVQSQARKVVPFHGYLSTGAFIGIQMLNIARRVLEASEGERLFVTCETYNCLPDPFQVLAGCTIGNKGLRVKDYGKMAVTVTKRAPIGACIKGVRIMLDPEKTAAYPRLHSWYMKTEKVPHDEAVSILISAGEGVYSWETFDFTVPERPEKKIAICERCKESFVLKGDGMICQACLEKEG